MSLTRDEWAKMWESIKQIEYTTRDLMSTEIPFRNRRHYGNAILERTREIKKQIQQVIGQME
jgi:hypothetical protein